MRIGTWIRRAAIGTAVAGLVTIAAGGSAQADLWGPYASANNAYWGQATGDVLRPGDVSNEVGFWEAVLVNYGQVPWQKLDGWYWGGANEYTYQGTKNVQAFWGLTADGVVGPGTWAESARWTHTAYYGGQTTVTWFPFGSNQSAFTGQQIVGGTFAGYWGWSSCYANGGGFINTNTKSNPLTIANGHWCGP
jgi:hypothetical protein